MSSQARPAGWQSRQLPASCARQAGDEAPKAAVFAASLSGTVGGKELKYKLRAEFAGHCRDIADPF